MLMTMWGIASDAAVLRFHQVEEEIDYEQRRARHMETDAGPCRAPPPMAGLTRAPNAINLPTMGIGYVYIYIYHSITHKNPDVGDGLSLTPF